MGWFVTGCRGQLGRALGAALDARGVAWRGSDQEVDVADPGAVAAALAGPQQPPEVLVNAAAFTQVDACERDPDRAERVNAVGPAVLSRVCGQLGVRLIHLSTDYVFDGECDRPYTEEDPPAPLSVYGRSKLSGERAVLAGSDEALVVRTSWLFGEGRNFIAAVLAQAAADEPLRVVADQRGGPTYAVDLAAALIALVEAGSAGLYHLANAGEATWWDVARRALDGGGYEARPIQRIQTDELQLAAPRPKYSVLDCRKARQAGVVLRDWQAAVDEYVTSAGAQRSRTAGPARGGEQW